MSPAQGRICWGLSDYSDSRGGHLDYHGGHLDEWGVGGTRSLAAPAGGKCSHLPPDELNSCCLGAQVSDRFAENFSNGFSSGRLDTQYLLNGNGIMLCKQ